MPGITIAAIMTIAIALGAAGLVIFKRLSGSNRLFALLGIIASGAAFFGAYYLLRLPLNNALLSLIGSHPDLYHWGNTLSAPVTEEPAKWIVLLPLFLTGRIKLENKGAWALCLGLGFGVGEILFLGQIIAANPQTWSLPWYFSSGFIIERLMVCVIHSALVLIAAEAFCRRKYWMILLAPVFHWLLNFPIFLAGWFPFADGGALWGQLLWTWTTLFFTASLVYLGKQFFNTPAKLAPILGRAVCPECGTLYVRPWRGINRIGKRYERCPNCKHNHWTSLYVEKTDDLTGRS